MLTDEKIPQQLRLVWRVLRGITVGILKTLKWLFFIILGIQLYAIVMHVFVIPGRVEALGEALCKAGREGRIERLIDEKPTPHTPPFFNFAKFLIKAGYVEPLHESCDYVVVRGNASCFDYHYYKVTDPYAFWWIVWNEFGNYSLELWSRERYVLFRIEGHSLLTVTSQPTVEAVSYTGTDSEGSCPAARRMLAARKQKGLSNEWLKSAKP